VPFAQAGTLNMFAGQERDDRVMSPLLLEEEGNVKEEKGDDMK